MEKTNAPALSGLPSSVTPSQFRQLETNLANDCKRLVNVFLPFKIQNRLVGQINGQKSALLTLGYKLNDVESIMTRDIGESEVELFCDLMK